MSIDLSKLSEAVTKVASLASERDAAIKASKAAIASAQADIDQLADQLLAAVSSPAEAVGIAAVAEALATPVTPQTLEELNAQIAAQNAAAPSAVS
ncbi:hypothetical protein [Bradyrhizobium sp. BR 10289]|uniref:hypothetical protein n=1 Tax=Bradyrhizobium sp. BR 10289 TaxID=2749993 RepID=UPI001C644F20|nr:hypothetical protein [Bradyrhizobium sp. BR 10289]MBW7970966.1 hypothetical protein [Bradyrhizobium sp. BR 10289]